MTIQEEFEFLRKKGCRCFLAYKNMHPVPLNECNYKFGNRQECWFIDSLKLAKHEEYIRIVIEHDAKPR